MEEKTFVQDSELSSSATFPDISMFTLTIRPILHPVWVEAIYRLHILCQKQYVLTFAIPERH